MAQGLLFKCEFINVSLFPFHMLHKWKNIFLFNGRSESCQQASDEFENSIHSKYAS